MTTTTDTLTFEWSLSSADGAPPARLQTLAPRTEVNVPAEEQPDLTALELLRSAGLHFDQEALTPPPGQRQLTLAGEAPAEDVALAMLDAVRERNATLAVDATSKPIRLFEVASVTSPLLVVASAASGAHQIPPEHDAIGDALRRAIAEREHRPPAGTPASTATGAAGSNGSSETADADRHRLSEDDVAPDVSHGGERADEMVMQEPEQQRYVLREQESSRREQLMGVAKAPINGAAGYAKQARVAAAVVPLSIAGAAVAARKFGSPRRWFAAAAITSAAAAAAEVLLMRRRRKGERDDAAQELEEDLADERVEFERYGTDPTP